MKCFTHATELLMFLKEMAVFVSKPRGLEPIGDLATHFWVISCHFVNQLEVTDFPKCFLFLSNEVGK